MPEGDTIRWAANRLRPVLEGHVPDEIRTIDGPRRIEARAYGRTGRPCPRGGDYDGIAAVSSLVGMNEARLRRVGHKGADLIAPGNTHASFDAALQAGVDMIEFDVLPEQDGARLLLAHDYHDAGRRSPHTLEEGLEYLAAEAFKGIELDVDLKLPGYELQVLEALRAHGMLERSLISSQFRTSLEAIRAVEPSVRLGWSVPKLKRDPLRSRALRLPVLAAMLAVRAALPWRAERAISAGDCDALMVHWRLVTPRLVRNVRRAGGELYVWTVDDLPRLRALHALGVTGVISNDPRLFAALAA